jgi:hypothetical protein
MTEQTNDAAPAAADDLSATTPASPANRNASRYTAEIAERILNELQTGRSLLSVSRDDGMPSYATIYGWVVRNVEGFAERYARAIEIGGRRGARAIRYSIDLADHIMGEVERGRSLRDVSRDEGMPSYPTLLKWIDRIGDFATRYHRAHAIGNPPRGGETLYTAEIAERILAGLSSGRSVLDICRHGSGLPSASTVYQWVAEDREGFCERYYAAREAGRRRLGGSDLYTPELAERILHEIADGRTLRDICRAPGMPAAATVRLWVSSDRDGFAARFERVRKFALRDMADELREIIDDGRNDWMERRAQQGDPAAAQYRETAKRSRLRYDGRRWILSKELPEIYGDRIASAAKEEANNPWADFLKLVDGKSRGLPSEDQPIDEREWEEFERKCRSNGGLPTDRL